jgi:omega-6 fatty acid desaturase / acyl-lipid omega-6 desaturase (Delta-12 desaturase)
VSAYYLIPYMIANYHLVLITYLQHTDVFMPHFRGAEWSWLRGKENKNINYDYLTL